MEGKTLGHAVPLDITFRVTAVGGQENGEFFLCTKLIRPELEPHGPFFDDGVAVLYFHADCVEQIDELVFLDISEAVSDLIMIRTLMQIY